MQASRPPATPPWQPSRATLPALCFLAVRAPAPKDRRHHCHSKFQSREKGEMRETSGQTGGGEEIRIRGIFVLFGMQLTVSQIGVNGSFVLKQ